MPDIPGLMQYQLGTESTWGTEVAPTAKLGLIDDVEIQPEVEGTIIKEKRGSLAPGFVAALNKAGGSAKVSGVMTYEDTPYWFDSLAGQATPSGAGPYVYAHNGVLGTVPTRRKLTLVKGQGTDVHSLLGGIVNEMTIKVESGKEATFEASLIGKKTVSDSLAALSDRTLNPVLATHFALYIDAVGGTIGTTAITNIAWFAYELKLSTKAETYFSIGNLNPFNYREDNWDVTLNMTLELASTSKAYVDSIIGSTLLQHQIRAKATDSTRIMQLDTAVAYLKAPKLYADNDGVVTVELEGTGIYNAALANYFKSSITNGVASLV